jgi:hypothetical protein
MDGKIMTRAELPTCSHCNSTMVFTLPAGGKGPRGFNASNATCPIR